MTTAASHYCNVCQRQVGIAGVVDVSQARLEMGCLMLRPVHMVILTCGHQIIGETP